MIEVKRVYVYAYGYHYDVVVNGQMVERCERGASVRSLSRSRRAAICARCGTWIWKRRIRTATGCPFWLSTSGALRRAGGRRGPESDVERMRR